MITIDGAQGEGGGQILRSSLSLSMLTGEPFKMINIRAGRSKPGLLRQHLTAVQAAAKISNAEIDGAMIGSMALGFKPGKVTPGDYAFAIGTAGSVTLVLQTLLLPLLSAEKTSTLKLEGGTHNPFAPPFDFIARVFLPLLTRMGASVDARLARAGFYPAGGGEFTVSISPSPKLKRLELIERGERRGVRAIARVAALPRSIAQREVDVIAEKLSLTREQCFVEEIGRAPGPGNIAMIEVESANVTELFTGFGEKGVSAETVAEHALAPALEYLASSAPVGCFLADQLLLPMAVGSGGVFRTLPLTPHTRTNIDVIQMFTDARIRTTDVGNDVTEVAIG